MSKMAWEWRHFGIHEIKEETLPPPPKETLSCVVNRERQEVEVVVGNTTLLTISGVSSVKELMKALGVCLVKLQEPK